MVAFRVVSRSPETAVMSKFPSREHRQDARGRAAGRLPAVRERAPLGGRERHTGALCRLRASPSGAH
jgi:hypothetical protein